MVRKPTVIILIIFALALLAGWTLEFSPLKTNRETPSPTQAPKLVTGLESGEITTIDIRRTAGPAVSLAKNAENQFQFVEASDAQPDQGKLQEMLSELLALEVSNTVDPTASLETFGLSQATATIVLQDTRGNQRTIVIGNKTPTASGYYARVDAHTPVVVSTYGVERVLELSNPTALIGVTSTP